MVTAEEIERAVLAIADEIHDPCSVAAADALGLVEMGLIRGIELGAGGASGCHDVTVHLRLTAPGCLYWLYFERELQTRISALAGVGSVRVERDRLYDWDESEIEPAARERLRRGRRRRAASMAAQREHGRRAGSATAYDGVRAINHNDREAIVQGGIT